MYWPFEELESEMETDNRQTAGQKRQRVGLGSSDSESSSSESSSSETDDTDSESDGSSDTDTDSDAEEEDSGFLDRKPVRAKPKVSKKTTTKNQKAGVSNKTNKKEKNGKDTSQKIPAKKPRTQPSKRMNSKENKVKVTCQEPHAKTVRPQALKKSSDWENDIGGTSAQTVNGQKGKANKPRQSKKKVKQGVPEMDELEGLGRDIGKKWKTLGRRLKVSEELDSIDAMYDAPNEKAFEMLKYWTQKKGSSATYRILSGALKDELLERKDLSEKYCYG